MNSKYQIPSRYKTKFFRDELYGFLALCLAGLFVGAMLCAVADLIAESNSIHRRCQQLTAGKR